MKDETPTRRAIEFLVEALEVDGENGKKEYRDEVMLKITESKNHIACRKATDEDKERFPNQWAKFEASSQYKSFEATADENGDHPAHTPLDVIEGVGPAAIKSLDAAGIRSVEQLAEATDEQGDGIRGFAGMRERALDYVTRKD